MNLETFMERVYPEPNTGCWLWAGSVYRQGYGKIKKKYNHGFCKAHRLSYFFHYGEFDRSLFVLHNCDNTYCVNPDHLRLGTIQDNNKDMILRNRRPKSFKLKKFRKGNNRKLDEIQVRTIRSCFASGTITQRALAVYFRCEAMGIHTIVKNKQYTWV